MDIEREIENRIENAIEQGDLAEVDRLIQSNDSFLFKDTLGGTWLQVACSIGRLDIVDYFVRKGIDPNVCGNDNPLPPLCLAAMLDHPRVVKYLLEAGAEKDVSSPDRNALFSAIYKSQGCIAKLLLDAGFDANVVYRSATGKLKNALSYARERGDEEIVELLINADCRLPIEGVDKPINETQVRNEEPAVEHLFHNPVVDYMNERFGQVDELASKEIVPVFKDVHVAICVIRPNNQHHFLTLFTSGMSDRPMKVPEGQENWQYAELVMHLPADWAHPREVDVDEHWLWPLQWLRKVAYYPHLNDTWLGSPATIISSADPPEPLGPNTTQTCLLMVPDFGNLQPLTLEDGRVINFWTVVPLYTEERDYELQHGMRAFFERFMSHKVPMTVDIHRPSFVD